MRSSSRKTLRVACVQNSAGRHPAKNLKKVLELTQTALKCRPDVIALPENFYWRGAKKDLTQAAYEATPVVVQTFCALARKSRTAFILGSVIEPSKDKHRFYNTLIHIDPSGKIRAAYRKIHLFDVRLPQGISICESDTALRGREVVTSQILGKRAGYAICYDLRFPELFRALTAKGSRMIFLPANFTKVTGHAHWETLIRARAIENQVFMIAPAQTGKHPVTGVASYGTSMIVDPWGKVLAQASGHREEVIWADLGWERQSTLRREFPVLQHCRLIPSL
ncbi:MAG: carbon-nitrogen hydrolase family protein [Candidatus Omnitrophica bacterium]|nr:carbon-nitrogen hydrolase family protein [Candidatus Omnitrophota bacterium]